MPHNELEITALQRLCLHDGPGVRTTVFMKGCSLDCPWCCNPETKYGVASHYADGTAVTQRITTSDLFARLVADRAYYGTQGGVTFSGGEPLLWGARLVPLAEKLRQENINIYVETSLHAPQVQIEQLDPYVEGYVVDVKRIDRPFLKQKGPFDFNRNFTYLRPKIWLIRMVLIDGVTDTQENISKLKQLTATFGLDRIEFLQYHNLGNAKASKLGLESAVFGVSSPDRVQEILEQFPTAHYSEL